MITATDPNQIALMKDIKQAWGDLLLQRPYAAEFLAGLIANESGGNHAAERFEPTVCQSLSLRYPEWPEDKVKNNATSWGLTQIMGINYSDDPVQLLVPSKNIFWCCTLLTQFTHRWGLSLQDPEFYTKLFDCWNTGRPDGKTYDPDYAANGAVRMTIYKSL